MSALAVRLTSTLHRATKTLSVLRRALTDGTYRYLATTTLTGTRIQGVETELKIPFNDEWKLSINYTYNDGRDVSNGENKPLSDLPFHTANGTLDWKPAGAGRLVILCFWSLYRAERADSATAKTPGGYTIWNTGAAAGD